MSDSAAPWTEGRRALLPMGFSRQEYWGGLPKERASLIAQLVKSPPAVQETPVRSLGQEDPLEKG